MMDMSGRDQGEDIDANGEPESGFLARWSRRKRADNSIRSASIEQNKAVILPPSQISEESLNEVEAPEEQFDLSSLPPIESITKDSDLTAFMQKGVPDAIKNNALRAMWSADPFIRDDTGPVDYAWDFNNPDSIPGFGELGHNTDIAQMLSEISDKNPTPHDQASSDKLGSPSKRADDVVEPARHSDAGAESDNPPPALMGAPEKAAELTSLRLSDRPKDLDREIPAQEHSGVSHEIDSDMNTLPSRPKRRHGGAIPI